MTRSILVSPRKRWLSLTMPYVLLGTILVGVSLSGISAFAVNDEKTEIKQEKLVSPVRLDLSENGKKLFVSDYDRRKVAVVDPVTLEVKRSFPVPGKPLAVAYSRGTLYIGNEDRKTVEICDPDGSVNGTLGTEGFILSPTDIAVDGTSGRIFVVDAFDKAIKIFSLAGDYIFSIPSAYPDTGVLTNPTAIALDKMRKEVLVSDYGDGNWVRASIKIFDYDGNHLKTISGKAGMLGNRFSRPQGLSVDGTGRIFVLDCYSSEILVLDRLTGDLLETMAGYGDDPGQLKLPLDLVIAPKSKDIYVTNNRAGRVDVYREGALTQ